MGTESGGLFGFVSEPFRQLGIEPTGMPLVGPMFGASPADKALTEQMKAASAAYQAMRPEASQASTQAMQNMLGGIAQPGNQMMGDVYGQGAMMDFNQATQNPVTPGMAAVGQQQPGGGGSPGLAGLLGSQMGPLGVVGGPAMMLANNPGMVGGLGGDLMGAAGMGGLGGGAPDGNRTSAVAGSGMERGNRTSSRVGEGPKKAKSTPRRDR